MLTLYSKRQYLATHSKQKGVVLLITLIMLVAMTLAAIALMRSVDTTNLVAGNLSFQQSALHTADGGTEEAIAYLYTIPDLMCNGTGVGVNCVAGYKSFHQPALEPPSAGVTWESYWNAMVNGPGVVALVNVPTGYSGAFIIEAMCASAGKVNCTTATTTSSTTTPQGQDMGSQSRAFITNTTTTNANYYRITTRVEGPRNSVGYVQALIAL
ncbi:MAG: hypothetical protein WCZ98_04290 [Sideroxydans sp.]